LGKHIAKSEHLQAEIIDLPQKMEDMQFYCLKLREDLITALVAKERNEETFRSEILFLKGW
jgi:rab5 binding